MLSGLVSSGMTGPTRSRARISGLTISSGITISNKNNQKGAGSYKGLTINTGNQTSSSSNDHPLKIVNQIAISGDSYPMVGGIDYDCQVLSPSLGLNTLSQLLRLRYGGYDTLKVMGGGSVVLSGYQPSLEISTYTQLDQNGALNLSSSGQIRFSNSSSFSATKDVTLLRDAAGTLAQRNGVNAQTFRVYNTYTSATSYETLNLKGKASANFEIGPENGSAGGTLRGLTIGGYALGSATITGWLQFRPNATTAALEAFYLGPIADSTATGGNARGTGAVDLQTSRTAAAQVASGIYSFCQGYDNNASGAYSFASGYNSTASAYGMQAHAAGYFAANGDAQSARFVLRRKTTDATATTLMLDGSTTRLTITSGKIMFADILISGIKSDGSASSCYKRKVAIKNVGGTTSLVGTVETIGTDIEDNAATDVAITADNTNDALQIDVTGIAAETWRWVAVVQGLEIAYGT